MSGSKGFKRQKNRRANASKSVFEQNREVSDILEDSHPTIEIFKKYAAELDDKHDRYERIVKISRDITIESKRIIFFLHNVAADVEGKKEQVFLEAERRLTQLLEKFKLIALELNGQDPYLYLRAYTCGIQEYLEALAFYKYQQFGIIPQIGDIHSRFKFVDVEEEEKKEIVLCCPVIEIMLALCDFTGEMMRKCINNLGSGNIDDCFKTCKFVQNIYVGFLGLNHTGHSLLWRKLYVLKQSLTKMELVCYNIKVRGSEVPKHMLATVVTSTAHENDVEDEGFF